MTDNNDSSEHGKQSEANSETAQMDKEPISHKIARGLGYACSSLIIAVPVMLSVFRKKKN